MLRIYNYYTIPMHCDFAGLVVSQDKIDDCFWRFLLPSCVTKPRRSFVLRLAREQKSLNINPSF